MNPIQAVKELGQSIWLDYIQRSLLTSGKFQALIDQGITGVTSNPSIFEKAIVGSSDYDEALRKFVDSDKSTIEIYELLAVEDIRAAADLLRPVYDQTSGLDGYVSLEVDPSLAYDTERTVSEAERLFNTIERPNIMIKVPGTSEGIPAVRQLIGKGVNVNVTLLFSLELYARAREAYISGLEALAQQGKDVSRVASVASFFVSRVDTAVDAQLQELIAAGREDLRLLLGTAAVSNAKMAYQAFKETFGSERFAILRQKGAMVQRPLWASTSTKNPAYSDILYVEPLIGPDTVNTLPPETIEAFMDHGKAQATIEQDVSRAKENLSAIEAAGISIKSVTDKLLSDGVKAFVDSFEKLLNGIDTKRKQLAGS